MLSDRPYMRGDYQRETTSVVTWLICAIAGAFVLQIAAGTGWLGGTSNLVRELAFSVEGLSQGRLWSPFTHWLVHSTGNLFHVGLVLAGLFLLGRELASPLGARGFVAVFGGSILTGAMLWSAVHWQTGGSLFGATAGLYGLAAAYALLYPNREIRLLLFFFFPVTLRPRYFAGALLLVDALAMLLFEIFGRASPFDYAPSAHLGGMLAGWIYCRFLHQTDWRFSRPAQPVVAARRSRPVAQPPEEELAGPPAAKSGSRGDIRVEIDRILDKINRDGLAALTPAERRVLDDAKDLLSRR